MAFQPNNSISTTVHRDRNAHSRVAHDIQQKLIAPLSILSPPTIPSSITTTLTLTLTLILSATTILTSVTHPFTSSPRRPPPPLRSRSTRTDNIDSIVYIAESDAVRACRRLARRYGLLVGGSTGSVVAAIESLGPVLPSDARVVAIAPDLGDRYLDTIYQPNWVLDLFGEDALRSDEAAEATPAVPGPRSPESPSPVLSALR